MLFSSTARGIPFELPECHREMHVPLFKESAMSLTGLRDCVEKFQSSQTGKERPIRRLSTPSATLWTCGKHMSIFCKKIWTGENFEHSVCPFMWEQQFSIKSQSKPSQEDFVLWWFDIKLTRHLKREHTAQGKVYKPLLCLVEWTWRGLLFIRERMFNKIVGAGCRDSRLAFKNYLLLLYYIRSERGFLQQPSLFCCTLSIIRRIP